MLLNSPFQYNTLKPKDVRLFKLNLTAKSKDLLGNIITIRHPCQFDFTLENISGIAFNRRDQRDVEFVQSSASRICRAILCVVSHTL